jgi:hypothetical protein
MITIALHQEVAENKDYQSCESGEFSNDDFVMCKRKSDEILNTVMFLAHQIVNNESSN